MPTGQAIINAALTTLGILEQGGSPSASDSVDALAELNAMWDAWGIDEGLIYALTTATKALVTATASYTIGTGAVFNVVRPTRIYKAFFTLAGNRNELKVIEAGEYYDLNDQAASTSAGGAPQLVYPDFNVSPTTGFAAVYLWPIPVFTTPVPNLELIVGAPFTTWALATNYNLPYGFQDAIQYALAWRLIPRFGQIVTPEISQVVAGVGAKAEQRIREMNALNRKQPPEVMAIPTTAPPQKVA